MSEPYVIVELLGAPRGKGRHRSRMVHTASGGSFIAQHPDPKTEKFEKQVALAGRVAMMGKAVLDEALSVHVEAILEIPKSWSRKKQAAALAGDLVPTGRPDDDNYLKVRDALDGIVWREDSVIVRSLVDKRYGTEPCWRITVWRWFEPQALPESFWEE